MSGFSSTHAYCPKTAIVPIAAGLGLVLMSQAALGRNLRQRHGPPKYSSAHQSNRHGFTCQANGKSQAILVVAAVFAGVAGFSGWRGRLLTVDYFASSPSNLIMCFAKRSLISR
jgi:hypothetical protein